VIERWRDNWRRTPRPLKRPMLWFLLPIGVMALQVAVGFWRPDFLKWLNPGLVFLVTQTFAVLMIGFTSRRIRRDFVESGGRLCTQCAHSLAGLGDSGVCPECGGKFSTESDRIGWAECNLLMDRAVRERDAKNTAALNPRDSEP